jgi:L-ascorbate metabolism protein UlaG (beta-lactamase superfamily)
MPGPKVTWIGHAGFRIEAEYEGQSHVIYIDAWLDNPKYPQHLKDKGTPSDADLILVTHGHFDHSSSAPIILGASTKPGAKIACIYEIG